MVKVLVLHLFFSQPRFSTPKFIISQHPAAMYSNFYNFVNQTTSLQKQNHISLSEQKPRQFPTIAGPLGRFLGNLSLPLMG